MFRLSLSRSSSCFKYSSQHSFRYHRHYLYIQQSVYVTHLCWLAVGRFCPDPSRHSRTEVQVICAIANRGENQLINHNVSSWCVWISHRGHYKLLKWVFTTGCNPTYCVALLLYKAQCNQWHLLWRHLQTVSYSHSPATSTSHLQKTRQHTTSLMCYIQWSIENKTAMTWRAAHTIFFISVRS